jgi:nitrous oxide reductase accessory protein NosL
MFVAKYPDWIAEVRFRDGGYAVFDGPKDLFKYLADLKRYAPNRRREDISSLYVMDYYTLRPIDGAAAFYVTGSDVYGPMGAEFIPFEKESDAREFLKDHGGRQILRFKDITPAVLKGVE